MKMNFGFTVIARCQKFETGTSGVDSEKVDIELTFDLEKAMRFLFRFYENVIIIDEYKMFIKSNENSKLKAIALFKDDYTYLVLNENQLVNDILKGYNYLVTMEKVTDIMEFDFNAAIDFNNSDVEDEFDNN